MKDVFTSMILHPFRTAIIISAAGYAISDVINAVRGVENKIPRFNFVVNGNRGISYADYAKREAEKSE